MTTMSRIAALDIRANGEHIRRILLDDTAGDSSHVHAQLAKIFNAKIAPAQKAYQYDQTRSVLLQSQRFIHG